MAKRRALCHYCRTRVGDTKDHIVPKGRGGSNAPWNLVPACQPCNARKGNKWPTCTCLICRNAIERHVWVAQPDLDAEYTAYVAAEQRMGWKPKGRMEWERTRGTRPAGNATDYFDRLLAEMKTKRAQDEAVERQREYGNG